MQVASKRARSRSPEDYRAQKRDLIPRAYLKQEQERSRKLEVQAASLKKKLRDAEKLNRRLQDMLLCKLGN